MLEWIWWVPIAGLIATSGIAVYLHGHQTGRKEAEAGHGKEIAALKGNQDRMQWQLDHLLEKAAKAKTADPKTEPEQPKPRDFYRWR